MPHRPPRPCLGATDHDVIGIKIRKPRRGLREFLEESTTSLEQASANMARIFSFGSPLGAGLPYNQAGGAHGNGNGALDVAQSQAHTHLPSAFHSSPADGGPHR